MFSLMLLMPAVLNLVLSIVLGIVGGIYLILNTKV